MDRLAAFLATSGSRSTPPTEADGVAVASADGTTDQQPAPAADAASSTRTGARQPQRSGHKPGLEAALALANTRP
jgi:hypothetical protein